jgi:hypothetical protein
MGNVLISSSDLRDSENVEVCNWSMENPATTLHWHLNLAGGCFDIQSVISFQILADENDEELNHDQFQHMLLGVLVCNDFG